MLLIRRARPDEAGVVLSLIRELAEYEKLLHEVEATEAMIADALFCEHPRLFCDIAEWNGLAADRITVTQSDGTALPAWLLERGGRLIVKDRPADVEYVYLQVRMASSQGASEIVFMRLNVITGELSAIAPNEINSGMTGRPLPESAPPEPAEAP